MGSTDEPGIGPEDFERISREMRLWDLESTGVVEEALRIVQEHWIQLDSRAVADDLHDDLGDDDQ